MKSKPAIESHCNKTWNVPIFRATSQSTGEVVLVDDLYWFEEQGIHDMMGIGIFGEEWELEFIYNQGVDL